MTFISFIRSFLIKQFISTLNIKLLFSILLHYSYKKTHEVVAKWYLKQQNSTFVWSLALFSICWEKKGQGLWSAQGLYSNVGVCNGQLNIELGYMNNRWFYFVKWVVILCDHWFWRYLTNRIFISFQNCP